MIDFQSSADGTKIAFERTGEGPALIIVGGALNSRRSADVLVPWLAPHFTVFAYDRRGRGESSDSPPYSPDREIEDLEALIAAAGGSAYAYGHSSGAILALEAAAAGAAISKLAAYEPPYLTGNVPEEPWENSRDRAGGRSSRMPPSSTSTRPRSRRRDTDAASDSDDYENDQHRSATHGDVKPGADNQDTTVSQLTDALDSDALVSSDTPETDAMGSER